MYKNKIRILFFLSFSFLPKIIVFAIYYSPSRTSFRIETEIEDCATKTVILLPPLIEDQFAWKTIEIITAFNILQCINDNNIKTLGTNFYTIRCFIFNRTELIERGSSFNILRYTTLKIEKCTFFDHRCLFAFIPFHTID